ncbi:LytTR family DNA-binding domain-containing protein [Ascidiimonas aurantiaca]|uniref:LytR/AlgR family response regulator transcription factor n=1 Tax=Ascidiimonas aurantiaca TaxID=1685432 RepID=UPI0030EBF50C
MFIVGFLKLGKKTSFPYKKFILLIALFSAIRYVYIYFFLSNHLPSYTIFHYPLRAIPITILGTAFVLFLGYSYAIYEWGLAAREKYTKMLKINKKQFDQPIKIRSSGKWVYLLSQDILYLKANGEYVDYHTLSNKYSCFQRLKQSEIEMVKFGFLKIHRSYVVNPIFVKSISVSEIIMKNNIKLPLSKKYKDSVTKEIESRLLRKDFI